MADYIARALEPVVLRYAEHFKVVVVTGPRQVGKTTMLRHLMEREASSGRERAYATMDDSALRAQASRDPELFLQRFRPPVLIDEIQKAPELLPYIKMLVDSSDEMGTVWLTGSQPFHLMRRVSESLAGRAGIIEMQGLSNAEIAGVETEPFLPDASYFVRRVGETRPFGVDEAYERICAGSLPGIRALPADLRPAAYDSYIDTYLMRDIRDLAQVGNEGRFRMFMSACAALTSKPIVYADLARTCDIDEKTAKTWLSLLESSYLVKIVRPYANAILKRLNKQPIMHFTDTGLAAHLAGWDDARTLSVGALNGPIFETYVFDEIDRSYANVGRRAPLGFFRNNDKKEIDLLMEAAGTLYPIEVKRTAAPRLNDTKNFNALDPVSSQDVPAELKAFKRKIGLGAVVCLAHDTYPLSEGAWAFPAWAI